ncbi:hypothetical protein QFC21_005860 [Naganishia friedmannii]|uniref:Uncharacterized protein n=1 Tax=Naganishia friedmannii TaxID=89922 RepID=A0ACC2V5S8_9TREE|nr:hypothetical protein QFC21_005860 [Naganishia friedmannii]
MRPLTAVRPALRLCIQPAVPTLWQSRHPSSSSSHASLDALFQSPKLRANPAFARQVRKKVSEYRAQQGQAQGQAQAEGQQAAGRAPGRHPLAPREEQQSIQTIHVHQPEISHQNNDSAQVKLYATHLVFSTSETGNKPLLPVSYTHLRDSCTCPACVQPSTLQKLTKAGQAYEELRPASSGREIQIPVVRIETRAAEQGLVVNWASPSGHESFYPFSQLQRLASPTTQPIEQTHAILRPTEWPTRAALLASPTLRIAYSDFLTSRATQHAFLAQLTQYGLVLLSHVPTEKTTDADCELRRAMAVVGELRNTFYGATWDVRALREEESRNIAYTDVDLGFHQDLCAAPPPPPRALSYFENPPRFQALHCLRNNVHGGSSYFTDSFAALRHMLTHHPDEYAVLKSAPGGDIPFVYDNDGYWYYRTHRTVEEAPRDDNTDDAEQVQFHAVNYSPPFQAPFPPTQSPETRDALFAALATFERLLAREDGMYEFTLREGEMVVFDNRRVLHARRAFWNKAEGEGGTGERDAREPTRWLKGCYMDGDVVWNKMRVMNRLVRTGEVEPLPEWKDVLRRKGLLG